MAIQWQIRRDTSEQWLLNNPVMAEGEFGVETESINTDSLKIKLGDGLSQWNDLEYFSLGQLPVYQAGTNITIDNTNPLLPVINSMGGGSSTLTSTVNITSSDLRNNFPSSPVITVVPAPGFNRYIKIKEIYAHYNGGNTSFNNGNSSIKLGTVVLNSNYTYSQEPTIGSTDVTRISFDLNIIDIQINAPLTFQNVGGNSQGDGNIDIIVDYEIIQL